MLNQTDFLNTLQDIYNNLDSDKAIEFIQEQLNQKELSHNDKLFLKFHLAREYFFKNEFEKSENLFKESVELPNKKINSLIYLSEIYSKTNRTLDSIILSNKVVNLQEGYAHILKANSIRINQLNNNIPVEILTKAESQINNKNKTPLISIIILCYNKFEYTKKCLSALFKNTHYENFELIVLDNASVDETPDYLLSFGETIKYIRSEKNLGFVGGNNYASQFAEGEYIVFLNNDTEPQPGWLTHLQNTFEYHKDAGAAGSMLIYPDGKLQEAGGVIFNDASGWNYGRGDDPKDSKYSYCKEVDYCSGAALMIKKDLFEQIGRFDERYSPAYYEDTDLCFSVRKFGYKVYVNPFSKVIHNEGATAGTDLNSGFKKFQVINRPKFFEKWKKELEKQYSIAQEAIEQAINFYSEGAAKIISKIDLLNLAGNLFLASNDFDKAKYYFEQELQHSPSSSSACYGLGQVFFAKEQFEAAKVMFEWAVKNDSNNSQTAIALNNVNEILSLKESVQSGLN